MTKLSLKASEQQKYNDFLYELLLDKLFESGSDLRKSLVGEFNISDPNARKVIGRAVQSHAIKSSKPYTFGNGQFIYLLNDVDLDVDKVMSICKKFRPPIFRLLAAMKENNGVLSYYEGLKVTASPQDATSTKVSNLKDILKVLVKLEFVYEKKDSNGVSYILFRNDLNDDAEASDKKLMTGHFNKMVIDSSLMPDIIRWLTKSNLIENANAIYRNKKTPSLGAKHNGLMWDAYSYTKATGINPTVGKKADVIEKQTLVVIDVVLYDSYSQIDLDGFLSRVQININSVRTRKRKVMPIIIYKSCSDLILNKIRKLGFLSFDIGSIFGTKIYAVLNKLEEINSLVLEDGNIDRSVQKLLKIIRASGQEDALKDLRGVLFEVLLFPVLRSIYSNANAERGKILGKMADDGSKESYEYDYIFNSSHPEEIIIIELKGYNSNATISLGDKNKKSSLKWFFERTLPFAKSQYKTEIAKGKVLKAVYITSANFWKDGKEYVAKLNATKLKSAKMNVAYDRTDLLRLLEENGFKREIKIIDKYYKKLDKPTEAKSLA